MGPKIDFGKVFFRYFFRLHVGIDFRWIFEGPKPEKQQFSLGKTMISTKSMFSKKHRKNLDLGVVFGGPNHENSKKNGVGNHVFFGH